MRGCVVVGDERVSGCIFYLSSLPRIVATEMLYFSLEALLLLLATV